LPKPVYPSYSVTTPVDGEVVRAMAPFFGEQFGNPSSSHGHGFEAKEAVEGARRQVC
jgi:cysteine desulfurase